MVVVVGRGVKYVFRHIKAIQLRPVREPSLKRRLAISFPLLGLQYSAPSVQGQQINQRPRLSAVDADLECSRRTHST